MNSNNSALDRHDKSIVNVIKMLRPILDELDLIGQTIPATELASICRRRKARLPFRNYNGLRMAEQLDFIGKGGSVGIGDISVHAHMLIDPKTHRQKPMIEFERVVCLSENMTWARSSTAPPHIYSASTPENAPTPAQTIPVAAKANSAQMAAITVGLP